jgi:inosine/xanthosine triphosphate pyrophosphatase family protein
MVPVEFSRPILVGTSNSGKLAEITRFAERLGFDVFGLSDPRLNGCGTPPTVAEVALSYAGNALLKGKAYAKHFGRPCLTDDTGLEIYDLHGLPGVHTARWGLARVIEAVGARDTIPARFVCAMAYVEPSGRSVVTHGVISGELRGMFVPPGEAKPLPFGEFFFPLGYSEPLGALVKSGFDRSHRFIALETLARVLA